MSILDVVENMAHEEGLDVYAIRGSRGTVRVSKARARSSPKSGELSTDTILRCSGCSEVDGQEESQKELDG